MARLIILEGPDAGQQFDFSTGTVTIGRTADNNVCINHASISRQHAVLTFLQGFWKLEDVGSQNGTFINGQKVGSTLLKGDCDIVFGNVRVKFLLNTSSAQEEQPFFSAEKETFSPSPMPMGESFSVEEIKSIGKITGQVLNELGRVIVGQKDVASQLLIAIAAGGHCLMIGLPGLAKTLMVSTLAKILRLNFKRVQFTPDLMPSDIIGTDILDVEEGTGRRSFRFIKGPIFTNMLLADEINRTPPKTQAALLEAMQEKQVTASNQIFKLEPPFFVLATQNPLEQEGTYPLPEAQLDRFMFNIFVDYPKADEEEQIVMATTMKQKVDLRQVISAEDIIRIQNVVRDLPVSPHVVKYATRLVRMTRPNSDEAPDFIKQHIHCGAGPRAAQCLVLGAKARAVLGGRVNVSCADVKALAIPVLRHRLFTNFTADSEGITTDAIVSKLVENVPEPSAKDY
ncbi:MAG: AAA family ATPase [Victivallales bacterium]|nr:AAA family ATPase [Victivallales bacterium]